MTIPNPLSLIQDLLDETRKQRRVLSIFYKAAVLAESNPSSPAVLTMLKVALRQLRLEQIRVAVD